ncbi:uncharacterized protein sS8_1657 [Methylocaldum marinum]|uniref:Peptidase metallopeptidase domain-containing protein n=1 Tax=Methylocaldum marinum TaxID=1432792 RepID=A0A250KPY8_9GAMM|nr:matrixin family metalloprotease [Methylocaldum marinum]BBA33614.1 uncharacterized protein sS8_1657 [Methylocaldum marinum]
MNRGTDEPVQSLFDRLYEKAKRIEVDGETLWRVEGDVLLDEDQLRRYARQQEALREMRFTMREAGMPAMVSAELVGMTEDDKILRWAPGLMLTYAVLRRTFTIGGESGYRLVVESMERATADWAETCGISFSHKPELDDSDSLRPEGARFVVREFDAGGEFIASAFFPNDPVHRRRILIDPSFYSPDLRFDKAGVLRHELGHVLGFRHEQIRSEAPPGCPDEDTYGTINLGDYDPRSVMHYFCGGVGSQSLAITELDKAGSQRVYGLPLSSYRFVIA